MISNEEKLREQLLKARYKALKPPPELTLVDWADKCRFLSKESASEPGKWKTTRVEVAREPMLCVTDLSVDKITIMGCTQLLKTELILNTIGYHVDQDPCPILSIQPTVEIAESFTKERVDPMLRDTPCLVDKVADKKGKESGNTLSYKKFYGGYLKVIGANAPGNLASRPIRILLCDEIDKYPISAGVEGDPIKIATKRTATFWNRKIIQTCSPTIEGVSRIAFEYEQSDQRVCEVPCPHCEKVQELSWPHVKWPDGEPEKAQYCCPHCGCLWTESERLNAIGKCTWRATQPFKGHAGFRISKLYSPWEELGLIASDFVESQKDPEKLKTFVNTQLAETWKQKGEAPEHMKLYHQREEYQPGIVPLGGKVLVAGIDIQKDRIEMDIYALGDNKEKWFIETRTFYGDTTQPKVYLDLQSSINDTWMCEKDGALSLSMVAIDSGYNTMHVYDFVRKQGIGRVIATKGVDGLQSPFGTPTFVDINLKGRKLKRGLQVWPVGSSMIKHHVYSYLKTDKPSDEETATKGYPTGYIHFHFGCDEEFFKQICSEQAFRKVIKGYSRYEWRKIRERNERLDTLVLIFALAEHSKVKRLLKEDIKVRTSSETKKENNENNSENKPERQVFLNQQGFKGLRGGW